MLHECVLFWLRCAFFRVMIEIWWIRHSRQAMRQKNDSDEKEKKKMFILFFVFSFIITRQFKDQTPPKTKKLKKKNFFLSFSSKWLGTLEATWPPNVQCRSQPENKIKLGNGLPSSQPAGPAQFLLLSFYDISLNLSWYLAFECRVLSSSSSKLPQLRHLCFYSSDFTAYKNTRTPVHGLGRVMWSCLLLYRLTV